MKTKEEIEKCLEDKRKIRRLLELQVSECDENTEGYIVSEVFSRLNILNGEIYMLVWVLECN